MAPATPITRPPSDHPSLLSITMPLRECSDEDPEGFPMDLRRKVLKHIGDMIRAKRKFDSPLDLFQAVAAWLNLKDEGELAEAVQKVLVDWSKTTGDDRTRLHKWIGIMNQWIDENHLEPATVCPLQWVAADETDGRLQLATALATVYPDVKQWLAEMGTVRGIRFRSILYDTNEVPYMDFDWCSVALALLWVMTTEDATRRNLEAKKAAAEALLQRSRSPGCCLCS